MNVLANYYLFTYKLLSDLVNGAYCLANGNLYAIKVSRYGHG
jgi:hypothetical protein